MRSGQTRRRVVIAAIAFSACGRIEFVPRDGNHSAPGDSIGDATLDNGCGFTAVAVGRFQTCAIATGGDVWCWGDNDEGQLGAPPSDNVPTGVRVALPGPAVEVGTGKAFSCARLADNTAWCWGNNTQGTLGDGTTVSSSTPVQVDLGGDSAVELEVGGEHACARRGSDGAIVCWGRNKSNAISTLGDVMIPQPTVVAGTVGTQYFELGHRHGCGVDASNEIFCWGRGLESQLGVGTANSASLLRPTGLPPVQSLDLSNRVSCMVAPGLGVRCWGTRYLGGASFDTYPPTIYVPDAVAVGTSNYAGCAVLSDTTVTCWGYLFDQTPAGLTTTPTPLGLTGVISVEGGWDHFCALTTAGLVCWGGDGDGQLGRGVIDSSRLPMPVAITCA